MQAARCFFALCILLAAMPVVAAEADCPRDACFRPSGGGRWFKGNTHAHSVIWLRGLIPHGDSGADAVALWYREHGYDFAVISDHNQLVDPAAPRMQRLQSPEFLLIPGVEVTSDYRLWGAVQEGKRSVHTTALNVREVPSPAFENVPTREILRAHIERTRAAGGVTIVNHPNYRHEVDAQDLIGLEGVHLFEVYNAHHAAKNHAAPGRLSTDELWDIWLTAGQRIYGVAADDAHHFKLSSWFTHSRKNFNLPGSAWTMVYARELTADAIVGALTRGHFYATTGVLLRQLQYDRNRYAVEVDTRATRAAIADPFVAEGARVAEPGRPAGVTIELIGPNGRVLRKVRGTSAAVAIDPQWDYVRARVTWVEELRTRIDDAPTRRVFMAWTQPAFNSRGDVPGTRVSDARRAVSSVLAIGEP